MLISRASLISLCVLAVMVSGCAGSAGNAPMPVSQLANPLDRGRGCQNDGGFKVNPCSITFDANNPGPVQVSVTQNGDGRGNGRGIRESDNCASQNIATIVRDSKGVYTVTAGTSGGSCSARFSDQGRGRGGHRNDGNGNGGNGNLRIVNDL